MGKKSIAILREKIPDLILQDVKNYHFQDQPWMCWITSIKNISLTMRNKYPECPSPPINKFHKSVGAWKGFVSDYQTVTYLINKKIYNNTSFKLKEKANSNITGLKSLVDNKLTSPIILSVHMGEYINKMSDYYSIKKLGYDIENEKETEGWDHILIILDVSEEIIFFDTFTPYLKLGGLNTSEKAIFKLPATIIDKIWQEAIAAPRWIMWLEKEVPYQKRLNI